MFLGRHQIQLLSSGKEGFTLEGQNPFERRAKNDIG
jgi:hypothetical protein